MDDAKLSPEMVALTGYVAVLTIVCVTTGAVVYMLRRSMSAASTAFHMFTGWVKENGWFRVLRSDSDPAYVGAVIEVLLQLAGTKQGIIHEQSALGSHCHHAERSIAVIRKVVHQAEKYGDVRSAQDLELFVASAQIEANQVAVSDGSTVFERTRGVKAMSNEELMAVKVMPRSEFVEAVCKMQPQDRAMLEMLRDRCDAIMAERRLQQGKRAEYNYAYRLGKEESRNVQDMTGPGGLVLGCEVSYKGDRYRMLEAVPDGQWPPAKVWLQGVLSATNCKWVAFNQVRPLSEDREPLLLPRGSWLDAAGLLPGAVVVYAKQGCSSEVELGVVQSVAAEAVVVQELEPKACKVVTFLPLWVNGSGSRSRRVAARACELPCLETVAVDRLITKVVIQDNFTLDEPSRKYMESLGVTVDLVASGT